MVAIEGGEYLPAEIAHDQAALTHEGSCRMFIHLYPDATGLRLARLVH